MAWTIEFERSAELDLSRLDRQDARRILRFLNDRLLLLPDPRMLGAPLKGPKLGQFWKYRVGDFRIIANIVDQNV